MFETQKSNSVGAMRSCERAIRSSMSSILHLPASEVDSITTKWRPPLEHPERGPEAAVVVFETRRGELATANYCMENLTSAFPLL